MADKIRAVLDTNVIVSALSSPHGPPGQILKALKAKRFILVSSEPMNDEVLRVLHYPHLDRYGLGEHIFDVAFILWEMAELVVDLSPVKLSKDPDDDKFLATAVGGQADYLVTGDVGDLLHLSEYKGVTILSPKEFLSVLSKK
ncbi:MAG: putative toxin-antitoxin system toxin component, PIN family [Elusimicrobia bacterium]|nr:putative toxin-antitoxin system toxin component, PIN family [Elusimicrobiota bacterium]